MVILGISIIVAVIALFGTALLTYSRENLDEEQEDNRS